ncbi:uncharacterized protein LOC112569272 [Pomacea canaliculata]|uniref:uncharacterized protein LOC112569272 n=1 Tax=Pomacea canaliculata TaxID=400727 RepID=UPI000D73828F|nr:uncharacterized protein LOC112569272 [Pomacea canaliculata]
MAALQDGSSCKGKIFILTVLLAWTTNQVLANGLRARPFPPVPWIVEIECSGRTLDADVDVLSMSLYDKDANEVLATLNLKTGDCTTTRRFSSCTRSQRARTTPASAFSLLTSLVTPPSQSVVTSPRCAPGRGRASRHGFCR